MNHNRLLILIFINDIYTFIQGMEKKFMDFFEAENFEKQKLYQFYSLKTVLRVIERI